MGKQQTYLIRNAYGEVYNEVLEPTVVLDIDTGTLHKIGEYDDVESYYNELIEAYNSHGYFDQANSIALFSLPKDQEIIDNVYNNTGYVLTVYKNVINQI